MAQNKYKRPMVTLGIIHIVDGVLLPICYGLSFIWLYKSTSTNGIATEVWGSILFFIPAGILGIIAGVSSNRGVVSMNLKVVSKNIIFNVFLWPLGAVASLVMNCLGGCATIVVVSIGAVVLSYDSNGYYYAPMAGDLTVDSFIILLGILEGVVCIVAAVYSGLMIRRGPQPTASTTVVYNTAMPQQYPGQPVQTQYAGQPVQILYTAQPAQGQLGQAVQAPPYAVGPPPQAQYVAPPPVEEKPSGEFPRV